MRHTHRPMGFDRHWMAEAAFAAVLGMFLLLVCARALGQPL